MKPTDKELEILQVLWKMGSATVRQVHEHISAEDVSAYTTTLKIMQIMNEKGLVDREKEGKTHIYHPLVSEESTQNQLIDRLVTRAFRGSAKKMMMQMLDSHHYTDDELKEIMEYIKRLNK